MRSVWPQPLGAVQLRQPQRASAGAARHCAPARSRSRPPASSGAPRSACPAAACASAGASARRRRPPAAGRWRPASGVQPLDEQRVVGLQQQLDGDGRALAQTWPAASAPARAASRAASSRRGISSAWQSGAGRADAARRLSRSRTVSRYCALRAAQARQRDQLAQVAVALAVAREQHQPAGRRARPRPAASNTLPIDQLDAAGVCRQPSPASPLGASSLLYPRARTTPATEHSSVIAMAA